MTNCQEKALLYLKHMSKILCFLIPLMIVVLTVNSLEKTRMDQSTLIQAHIVFRHGEKLFDYESTYPTDPHIGVDNFFPYKKGELSLEGRRKSYELGENLFKLYKHFIGPNYYSNIVEATSSGIARCEMTLLCVFSSLFPASQEFKIAENMTWQPILYTRTNVKEDDLLYIAMKHQDLFKFPTKDFDTEMQKNIDFVNLHSGLDKNQCPYLVYRVFLGQVTHKLELPEWANPIWPEPLTTISKECIKKLWKYKLDIVIGKLISKIILDSKKVLNGLSSDYTKMYVYSGHDINVGGMLELIQNPSDLDDVDYLSCFIVELHQINGVFGMKFFYKKGLDEEFNYLQIPGHGFFIPLEEFENFTKDRLEV